MATQAQLTLLELLSAKARTTTATGSAVDLRGYINPGGRNMKAYLNCGEAAGTTISIAVKLQDSDTTTAADFTDISGATFTTLTTTAAATEAIHFKTAKRYIRAVATHGTDMTSASYAVVVLAENRLK